MKLIVTGILGICCIAAASAAEVEYADGKVEVCEIVAEGADHLTIAIEEHKMKVKLKVLQAIVPMSMLQIIMAWNI